MRSQKTRTLVESALMIALSTILSFITIYKLPQGLIQMMLGFKNVMYCASLGAMLLCVLLDYLLAYAAMGLACVFGAPLKQRSASVAAGTILAGLLRYFCSFLSGIIIWREYAPDTMPVWFYSLTYNGSYMIPEIILTAVAAVLVMRVVDKQLATQVR